MGAQVGPKLLSAMKVFPLILRRTGANFQQVVQHYRKLMNNIVSLRSLHDLNQEVITEHQFADRSTGDL